MVTIIVAARRVGPGSAEDRRQIPGNFENVHPVTFPTGQGPEDLVEEYTRIVEASEAEEPCCSLTSSVEPLQRRC